MTLFSAVEFDAESLKWLQYLHYVRGDCSGKTDATRVALISIHDLPALVCDGRVIKSSGPIFSTVIFAVNSRHIAGTTEFFAGHTYQ